jgi:hypothetical protein
MDHPPEGRRSARRRYVVAAILEITAILIFAIGTALLVGVLLWEDEFLDESPTATQRAFGEIVDVVARHQWRWIGLSGAIVVVTCAALLLLSRRVAPPSRPGRYF